MAWFQKGQHMKLTFLDIKLAFRCHFRQLVSRNCYIKNKNKKMPNQYSLIIWPAQFMHLIIAPTRQKSIWCHIGKEEAGLALSYPFLEVGIWLYRIPVPFQQGLLKSKGLNGRLYSKASLTVACKNNIKTRTRIITGIITGGWGTNWTEEGNRFGWKIITNDVLERHLI